MTSKPDAGASEEATSFHKKPYMLRKRHCLEAKSAFLSCTQNAPGNSL